MIVGSILVFTGTLTAYTTPQLLGGNKKMMLATLLYQRATTLGGDWTSASVIALVMIVITFAVMKALNLLAKSMDKEVETLRKNKLLTMIATVVFLFLFLPLVIIVITSFGTEAIITFPIKGFTIDWYIMALTSKAFMSSLQLSFTSGRCSHTPCTLVIGVPAAYVLSRDQFKGKKLMKDFFLSPTMIPGIVVGYSLYQMIVVTLSSNSTWTYSLGTSSLVSHM